jgi:hypothetical protein
MHILSLSEMKYQVWSHFIRQPIFIKALLFKLDRKYTLVSD